MFRLIKTFKEGCENVCTLPLDVFDPLFDTSTYYSPFTILLSGDYMRVLLSFNYRGLTPRGYPLNHVGLTGQSPTRGSQEAILFSPPNHEMWIRQCVLLYDNYSISVYIRIV